MVRLGGSGQAVMIRAPDRDNPVLLDVAVTMTYDAQGRVATQKDAEGLITGATTTFDYVVNGDGSRVTTVTYPPTSFEPPRSPA